MNFVFADKQFITHNGNSRSRELATALIKRCQSRSCRSRRRRKDGGEYAEGDEGKGTVRLHTTMAEVAVECAIRWREKGVGVG